MATSGESEGGPGGSGEGPSLGGASGGDVAGGGENGEQRQDPINRLVQQHLSATKLGNIDISTPAGLASLSAIFSQALQSGLVVGEAAREEEKRKEEKKRKRSDEKAVARLEESPRELARVVGAHSNSSNYFAR
ncbi:unnamed protein product [Calypogeia fissa]